MAGVINKTARQFNIKVQNNKTKKRTLVRLVPALNEVDDAHWNEVKTDPYVIGLKKQGLIDFGPSVDESTLDDEPIAKSKSKSTPLPKPKKINN